jgi:sialate O-acetylesterase
MFSTRLHWLNGRCLSFRCGLTLGLLAGWSCCAWAASPAKTAVTHPYPEGDTGDLWLLAGQSNMAGNGTLKETIAPDPRILFFANGDEWMPAREPWDSMFFPSGKPHGMVPDETHRLTVGAGPGPFFARHLIQFTQRPMGIIGVGTGKSMVLVWNPELADKGNPRFYGDTVQRVIKAGGYGKLKGVVWYQGESDAVEYPSASKVYQRQLLLFIDRLRTDTGNPDLPFIMVQINRWVGNAVPGEPGKSRGGEKMADRFTTYTQTWEHVREVQRQVAEKRKSVYLVSSIDLGVMADPIHLDYESYQKLGWRIAEVALSEVYKMKDHATPIKLESVTTEPLHAWRSGTVIPGRFTLRVRFSGVSGRLNSGGGEPTGFEMRTGKADPLARMLFYRTEFDPQDPNVVLVTNCGPVPDKLKPVLYYGGGLNPYCNIVDDKGMSIPAFGPVPVPPMASEGPAGKQPCQSGKPKS